MIAARASSSPSPKHAIIDQIIRNVIMTLMNKRPNLQCRSNGLFYLFTFQLKYLAKILTSG